MAVLGDLERSIMDVLWETEEPLSVHDVHKALLRDRELAYTTAMTVLDRLAKKSFVDRELRGRAWIYTAKRDLADLVASDVMSALDEASPMRLETLNEIVSRLSDEDRAALREALDAQ